MAHISPSVYLVWASLSVMLGIFLVFHLWSFDRFKCIKWDYGPHSGTFRRLMTYSYLLSVPLLIVYAVGFAIIKCYYGFTIIPGLGIVPTPYELWSQSAQNAIFPLYLMYSIAWGLELVTHLEELCFWLFLIHSGNAQQDWFRSLYFKTWAVGSCIAVLAIPFIAIFTRQNVYKCEAYTFLTAGLGSLALTIWFLPILWTFPSFIDGLKRLGVDKQTLVRLNTFHELNCVRVVFRFMFTIPLVILGIDGVRPHQVINDKMIPTDFLGIISGIGLIVSSGLTLVIFFPRSVEREMELKEQRQASRRQRRPKTHGLSLAPLSPMSQFRSSQSYTSISPRSKTDGHQFDGQVTFGVSAKPSVSSSLSGLPPYETAIAQRGNDRTGPVLPVSVNANVRASAKEAEDGSEGPDVVGSVGLQPNRRNETGDVELGAVLSLTEVELARARSVRNQNVSSLVHQWRSPIEIGRPTTSRWEWQS